MCPVAVSRRRSLPRTPLRERAIQHASPTVHWIWGSDKTNVDNVADNILQQLGDPPTCGWRGAAVTHDAVKEIVEKNGGIFPAITLILDDTVDKDLIGINTQLERDCYCRMFTLLFHRYVTVTGPNRFVRRRQPNFLSRVVVMSLVPPQAVFEQIGMAVPSNVVFTDANVFFSR